MPPFIPHAQAGVFEASAEAAGAWGPQLSFIPPIKSARTDTAASVPDAEVSSILTGILEIKWSQDAIQRDIRDVKLLLESGSKISGMYNILTSEETDRVGSMVKAMKASMRGSSLGSGQERESEVFSLCQERWTGRLSTDADRLSSAARQTTNGEQHHNASRDHDSRSTMETNGKSGESQMRGNSEHPAVGNTGTCSEPEPPRLWKDFQEAVEGFDPNCAYKKMLDRKRSNRSFWHRCFDSMGFNDCIDTEMPHNRIAKFTSHWSFTLAQAILILINTAVMGYETDQEMRALLKEEVWQPDWLEVMDWIFSGAFGTELLIRLIGQRSWFWVAPGEWAWNVFDFVLVTTSFLFDFLNSGVKVNFIRTVRIVRVFRVARIVRVLRFFRQLRQMLHSILACLVSLGWAFVFLMLTIYMFSLVCLQGAANVLREMDGTTEDAELHIANAKLRSDIEESFGSLGHSMLSLLAAVTGGVDWIEIYSPLEQAGDLYSIIFVSYVLFVILGVVNVLTGVFLNSAKEFIDIDTVVQTEELKVEMFCKSMMSLFNAMDPQGNGVVCWEKFNQAFQAKEMQAYLGSMGLEPTHIRLVFDLLDRDHTGNVDLEEFTMGLLKLKGEAKAIDARIIQRELGMLPLLIKQALIAEYDREVHIIDEHDHHVKGDEH